MSQFLAIGLLGYGIWKCCRCWPGKAKLRHKKRIADADAESWCDKTTFCCCLWPLLWKGQYSPGWLGTSASCTCRILRLFCCMFLVVMMFALIGAIANVTAKADPHGQSFVEIWNATVQRKLAAATTAAIKTEL